MDKISLRIRLNTTYQISTSLVLQLERREDDTYAGFDGISGTVERLTVRLLRGEGRK